MLKKTYVSQDHTHDEQMRVILDESDKSLDRILTSITASYKAGSSTLEMLHEQGNHLENVASAYNRIEEDITHAEQIIRILKSDLWGNLMNFFKRIWDYFYNNLLFKHQKSLGINSRSESNSIGAGELVAECIKCKADRDQNLPQASISPPIVSSQHERADSTVSMLSTLFPQEERARIANIDKKLDQVESGVAKLKDLARTMGQVLDQQNKALEIIAEAADKNSSNLSQLMAPSK